MKRSTLMKLAFTLVAVFLFAGLKAQILLIYTQDQTVDMYQTVNTNFRVYVQPDNVYSPTYDATTNANINPASYWLFNAPVGLTPVTPASLATAINQNWVELTAATTGDYALTAAEQLGAAGCVDGTPTSLNVHVIAVPTAVVTTADPANRCGNSGPDAVVLTFTESVPQLYANYAFAVNELVETMDDVAGTNATLATATPNFVDHPVSAKVSAVGADGGPFTVTFNTAALNVVSGKPTRYTYTLVEPSDFAAGADGFVSTITHKSHYIGGNVKIAYTGKTTYVAIVAPIPVTGPIYHLSNTYTY